MNTLINVHVTIARDSLAQLSKVPALALPLRALLSGSKVALEPDPYLIRLAYHVLRSQIY